MRKKIMSCCAVLLACCMIAGCSGEVASSVSEDLSETINETDIQDDENYIEKLTPAIDFYGYVNAKELMKMELKPDESETGTWFTIEKLVEDQLNEIVDEIAGSDENFAPGSNEQLVHDLYWQIYNTIKSGDRDPGGENTEFIEKYINEIEAVSTVDELVSMWHDLSADLYIQAAYYAEVFPNIHDYRENILFFVLTTLVDLDAIRNNNLKATQARDELSDYLKLCGLTPDEVKERATDIIYMYYEIAGHSDPLIINGEKRYYESFHILTREECSEMLKNITYEQLVRSVGYDGELPDKIAVMDKGQLLGVDALIDDEHLREWKDIALINLLQCNSFLLPDKYASIGIEGLSPDETAHDYVIKYLGKQISELYAEKYYNKKKGEIVTRMCDDLLREYNKLINDADWLSDEGKAFLIEKLDNMKVFIGVDEPHKIDPKDAELIGSTLMKTSYIFNSYGQKKGFDDLFTSKPVNGFDEMNPITVNACYLPLKNCIVIPAGALNPDLFDENADYATNLGGIGALIGHEISHAFDSNGVKFDSHGNYCPDAMPKEDIKAFKEIQNKAIEYYSKFRILGSHVDGKLTLAENLADISGLQCVISIAGDPESQKKVFERFANTWKALLTDIKAKEYLSMDVHSPDSVRANATVALFDEFYEIYGVKEGDPMYIAPEDRIRRW